jgi:hypothetical protein
MSTPPTTFLNPMDGEDEDSPEEQPKSSGREHEKGRLQLELQRKGPHLTVRVRCARDLRLGPAAGSARGIEVSVAVTVGGQRMESRAVRCDGDEDSMAAKWSGDEGEMLFNIGGVRRQDRHEESTEAGGGLSGGGEELSSMQKKRQKMQTAQLAFLVELCGGSTGEDTLAAYSLKLGRLVGNDGDFSRTEWFTVCTNEEVVDISTLLQDRAAKAHGMVGQLPCLSRVMNFTIKPDSQGRICWDFFILLLVFYSSVVTPYNAAFEQHSWSDENPAEAQVVMDPGANADCDNTQTCTIIHKPDDGDFVIQSLDLIVDIVFWVDIFLSFWTGFDRGFEVCLDKKEIATKYLKGWFLIDFPATMPWGWVVSLFDETMSKSPVIGLLRLLKVLRLMRASTLIKRLLSNSTLHTKFQDAFNFLLYVGIVCHLLACIFFLLPVLRSCEKDQLAADAAFEDPQASTVGWYWTVGGELDDGGEKTCMQGSWRQAYDLETICPDGVTEYGITEYVLRVCQETAEFGYQPGKEYKWSDRGKTLGAPYNVTNGTFVAAGCRKCMQPSRLWIDSIYWSLTTMTTIGYGDRGPKTADEIAFCMFAELFGLAFFAILLTQINTVNDVLGETGKALNAQKDGVVQFLKHHDIEGELVSETISFLNFRASCLTGNAFVDGDPRFAMLSKSLRTKIKRHLNQPLLKRVRIFGWSPGDIAEEKAVRSLFEELDTSGDCELDSDEVRQLFRSLDLPVNEEQFNTCFHELGGADDGQVTYDEFKHWWYIHKNGKPKMDQCPPQFLAELSERMWTQAFDLGETVVDEGLYGEVFGILLQGKLEVLDVQTVGDSDVSPTQREVIEQTCVVETISAKDREPVFGFSACLSEEQYAYIQQITARRSVHSTKWKYADVAMLSREHLLESFTLAWEEGHEEMVDTAFCHYIKGFDYKKNAVGVGAGTSTRDLACMVSDLRYRSHPPVSGTHKARLRSKVNSTLKSEVASVFAKVDKLSKEVGELTTLLKQVVEKK